MKLSRVLFFVVWVALVVSSLFVWAYLLNVNCAFPDSVTDSNILCELDRVFSIDRYYWCVFGEQRSPAALALFFGCVVLVVASQRSLIRWVRISVAGLSGIIGGFSILQLSVTCFGEACGC